MTAFGTFRKPADCIRRRHGAWFQPPWGGLSQVWPEAANAEAGEVGLEAIDDARLQQDRPVVVGLVQPLGQLQRFSDRE
jgi:hypothetical protein